MYRPSAETEGAQCHSPSKPKLRSHETGARRGRVKRLTVPHSFRSPLPSRMEAARWRIELASESLVAQRSVTK